MILDSGRLRAVIEETIREITVRWVIAEVFRRYNSRPIAATAFFTGALLDIRFVMDAMRVLQGNGFTINAVLSKSAGKIIGLDAVKDALQSDEVYLEDQANSALWDKSELILIPTLTVNTAAKVAQCICDSVIPDAISKSLLQGKLVIAAREGSCPDCKQRMEKYAGKIPPAYAAALTRNLMTMQEYGVVFSSAKNYERRVRQTAVERLRSLGRETEGLKLVQPGVPAPIVRQASVTGKRIVGMADLMDKPPGERVAVGRDAIVTQLAQDHAARHGIVIVRS